MPLCTPRPLAESDQELTRVCKEARVGVFLLQLHDVPDTETSTESSPCSPQVVARTDEGGAFVVATAPTRHHLEADWEVLLAKLPEVLRALDASSAGGGAPLLTQAIAALSQRLSADTRSRQHQRFSIYEQRLSSDASATIRSATRAELGGVELDDGNVTTQEGGDCRRQSSDRQLSQGAEEEEEESEADVECEYVVPALALQAVSTAVPDAADGGEVESLELDASEIQLQRGAFGLPPGEPFIEYYLCGMEGPLQAHIRGKLYVWQHHLCFRPYVPCSFLGWNSLVVRFKDVVLIKKTLGHLVFPNAILVRTNKQKHIFVGLLRRDECLSIIEFLWEKRHETEPIIVSGQPLSRMLGMIKYPKESRELLQLFSLADTEVLVEQYVCSYKEGSLPTRGRMYISQNFICFTSTLIIQLRPTKARVILPFEHVVSITKDSTAFVIPNAIEVIVQSPGSAVQRQLFFQGFMSRDRTFSVLTTLWRRAKARQSSLRVLVCGASTPQGKHLTKLLVRRNVNVRAGIRYERLRKELVSLGSEVVTVDYNQPDSLRKAMEGVDKVVFIPPLAENMKQQTVNLVEAALVSKSVTHIVRLAPLASGNRVMETPIFCMHREAEQAIEKSGIPYTFLRCSPFMQSLFHFYDPAQANLAVPLGNAKTTLVDARDVAAAAAEVLCPSASTDPADAGGDCAQEGQLTSFRSQTRAAQTFHNQTINLSSREVLTCQQIADVMSTVLGKTVTYVDTSAVSFVNEVDSDKHLRLHGSRSAWFLRTLAESFAHAREDDVQSASDELAAILRHQAPISLEEFVRDHRDAFADNALIYFNSDEMNALFCLFTELDANSDGLLQWEDFHGAMKPAFHHPFIPQALCRAFDPDGSGYVDFAQFARGMSVMTRGHLDERLTLGFRMLDRDRNGLIHWPDLELFLESLSLNLVNMGLLSQRDLLLPDDTDPDVDDQLPEREGSFLANTFNFVARIPSGVLKRRNDDGEPPPPAPPSAASSGGGGSRLHCSAPDHERRGAASTVVGEPKPRSRRRGFLSSFVKIQSAILSTRPPADDGGSGGGDGASDNTKAGGVIAVKRSNSESTALDRRRRQRQQQQGAGEAGGGGDGQDDEGESESESESRVEGAGAKNEDDEKGVETRRRNFVLRFGAQLWAQLDVNKDGNVPLATWKEVLKKRTAYVESLGLLGNPEEDTSKHRRERRAKKALTLGHPSWDTVLHILLCIRRAIEEEVPEGAGEAHDLRREGSSDPLFGGLGSSATALISSALGPSADRADAPPPQFLVRRRCRLLESQASSAGGDGAWIGQSFAPAVFGQLRDAFGIDPLEYRVALGPERLFASLLTGSLSALEEIVSSGRSGSFLYRSVDGRYLIKTLPPEEKSFFRQILPSYFDHMIKNPNSLLTRFCGLHKISGNKGRTTSFVVMENVIHTDKPVHEQYDLKGSTVNRSVRLGEKDEMGSVAQKDNDFQRKLQLGQLAPTFVAQIESDCKWLEGHGICDYSLLVGIHHSPRDGRQQPDATAAERPPPQSVFKRHHGGVSGGGGSGGEVYWLGMIDILTTYSFKKKSEHTLKSIFHDPSQISAIPPGPYRERFVAYVRSIVE